MNHRNGFQGIKIVEKLDRSHNRTKLYSLAKRSILSKWFQRHTKLLQGYDQVVLTAIIIL